MKKTVLAVVCLAVISFALTSCGKDTAMEPGANTPTPANYFAYITNTGQIVITGFSGAHLPVINIPETIDGYPVIKIAYDAFMGSATLSSITASSVLIIEMSPMPGVGAFSSCPSLKRASFRNATYIGANAFSGSSNLTSVNFPNVEWIDAKAFYECSSLTSVDFPKGIGIYEAVFANCGRLPRLTSRTLNISNPRRLVHARTLRA